MSGMYFLSSDEQLHILAKQCGTPIDDMLSDYADYEQERYVYFVELNSAPANAVLRTDTGYKLSHADGAGFCNVVAYPRSMGSSISLNWDNTVGECTLAYILIPKTYLSGDWYSVGCLNKGWNEK